MVNTSKVNKLPQRDVFCYRQRNRNRVFAAITAFFEEEAKRIGITKRSIAEKLECDPAQITRWLSVPSNLTNDTVSDLLLGLSAEMDYRIVRFDDRPNAIFIHPFIAELTGKSRT